MTPATAETVSAVGTRKNTDLVTEGPAGPEVRYSNGGPAAVPAAGANGHSDRQQGGEEKEMLDNFDEVVGAGIETAPAGRGGAQHTVAFADDEAPKSGARSGLPVAPNAGTSADDQEGDQYARQIAIVKHKSSKTKEVSTPKPIRVQDVNFAGLAGVATAADVLLVKQARTRVRISRLKQGHVKGRHTEPDEKSDHRRLYLTFRMMLGVRVAVGRQSNPLERRDVVEEDFDQVDKYTFPPAGATGRLATPSHKLNKTFKFRDYAPKVFKKLRSHFGIEEASYMLSVAGDYKYLELITNSKSGSFFFYSHDQRYIIKAMKASEAKFFRKILKKYYDHHLSHPDSMLIQFCGMYMVKNRHRKIPFIVMKCVEGDTEKEIHAKFDLKGSSLGRAAKEGEKVLKDNDLVKYGKIHLGSQRAAFLKSAKDDAEFLRSVDVMDYSMLLVVHDSSRAAEDDQALGNTERRYSNFYTFADEALDRETPQFEKVPISSSVDVESETRLQEVARPRLAPLLRQASTLRFNEDGGVESELNGAPGNEVYFMGIIDILQEYTTKKHVETFWKSITHDRYEISCVHPKLYCDRFIDFLTQNTD
ncbi:unnamed protein product [Ascophyllum nodosum]